MGRRVAWCTCLAAIAVLPACNQLLGLDPPVPADATTAGDDAGPTPDAAIVRWGPFTNPAPLVAAAGVNEDDAILSADGQELYYAVTSLAVATKDLMRATRDNGTWNTGVPVTELNSGVTDSTPRFGAGDLAIYLATDRPGTLGLTDIWRATRATTAGTWQPPEQVLALSSAGEDRTPSPCLGDTRFLLLTTRNGPTELVEIVPAQSITSIATPGLVPVSPFVTADCLTLYFAAQVTGVPDYDLYVMQRPALDAAWQAPARIDELATTANETDPWLSTDGRHLIFSRDTPTAGSDVWEAFRDPL